jgi:two-component system response regulator
MDNSVNQKVINLLLVEDNPGDVELTREALKESKMLCTLNVVRDGVAAMAYLHKEGDYEHADRPDLILLDLNLPKKNGQEVLREIKEDEGLRKIPIVILTMSEAEGDVLKAYQLHANCYITKPVDFTQFVHVVRSIDNFWFTVVTLPTVTGKEC